MRTSLFVHVGAGAGASANTSAGREWKSPFIVELQFWADCGSAGRVWLAPCQLHVPPLYPGADGESLRKWKNAGPLRGEAKNAPSLSGSGPLTNFFVQVKSDAV